MDTLGIDVDATDGDNLNTFKRMNNETGEFTYDEVVVWFRMLSRRGKCQGLADCAEEYAQRLVTEGEMNQGCWWLDESKEFWSFMKPMHHKVLEKYGFDRGFVQLPLVSTPQAHVPANVSMVTPGATSYGYTFPPTPPVPTGASGVQAATCMEGFAMRRPPPLNATQAAHAGAVPHRPPLSTVTAGTAGSEIADALIVGMSTFTNTFTAQMKESAKSQQVLSETNMLDKPVHGIIELQPEMGYKLTVNAFLTWLKSVEEAWGKVSASVTQVIAKLRSNLRIDENDLRMLISEKMNERLFTSLSDKVGGTLKKTVWPSQKLDGIGYLFAVLRVAVEPDQRDWSKRLAAFYDLPEIVPARHMQLQNALQDWLRLATEVIYSTQFTAESAQDNLRQFLRYYPDLVASVESIWQGSNKDYEVLEQIFVQLKREVAEATSRLSKATKHRWGNENAHAEQEDAAPSKNRSQGNSGRGRVRRGSSSDAEKEPKKEGSRPRSTSEPDLHAEKRQGKGKGKSRKLCWDYVETGTCEYGNDCRFAHELPQEEPAEQGQGGRGSNSTSQNTSKGGTVRFAKGADTADDAWYGDEDEAQELIRLRTENAQFRNENAELIERTLACLTLVLL